MEKETDTHLDSILFIEKNRRLQAENRKKVPCRPGAASFAADYLLEGDENLSSRVTLGYRCQNTQFHIVDDHLVFLNQKGVKNFYLRQFRSREECSFINYNYCVENRN